MPAFIPPATANAASDRGAAAAFRSVVRSVVQGVLA